MRNALTQLAETVEDPEEKKASNSYSQAGDSMADFFLAF